MLLVGREGLDDGLFVADFDTVSVLVVGSEADVLSAVVEGTGLDGCVEEDLGHDMVLVASIVSHDKFADELILYYFSFFCFVEVFVGGVDAVDEFEDGLASHQFEGRVHPQEQSALF